MAGHRASVQTDCRILWSPGSVPITERGDDAGNAEGTQNVMSDNENPQPGGGATEAPAAPAESPPNAALSSASTAAAAGAGGSPSEGPPSSAGRVWRAAALVCLTAGVLASAFGARALARHDAASARNDFGQTSTSIASTLNIAIKREDSSTVSASTVFAERPHASAAAIRALEGLGAHSSPLSGARPRSASCRSPAPRRHCCANRDAAAGIWSTPSARGPALAIETPVYRGAVTPSGVFGRGPRVSAGCARCWLPGVVLGEAIAGQEGYAARLRYSGGASALEYAHGAPGARRERSMVLRGGGA